MASFVLRNLPPWWNEVREKAKADGWPLHRLIVQLLDDYRTGRLPFPTALDGIDTRGWTRDDCGCLHSPQSRPDAQGNTFSSTISCEIHAFDPVEEDRRRDDRNKCIVTGCNYALADDCIYCGQPRPAPAQARGESPIATVRKWIAGQPESLSDRERGLADIWRELKVYAADHSPECEYVKLGAALPRCTCGAADRL